MAKLWCFLIFLGLSHIGKEMECEMTYKVKLPLIEMGSKGYLSFLRRGVMDGLRPRLWTGLKNPRARAPPVQAGLWVGLLYFFF